MEQIPAELTERMTKADGHINAAERRLWYETDRALWSGHQAVARLAEAWFKLQGQIQDLPPLEKYLPRDLMADRIDAFAKAVKAPALAACFQDILEAEAAVLAEPFSQPPDEDRAGLEAGLARQYRYIGGLRDLVRLVEDEIAARHVTLRRGDWVSLPDGSLARLIDRRGLTGQFLVPELAMTSPPQAFRLYSLRFARIETPPPPSAPPIGAPAYYWLLEADPRRQQCGRMIAADWVTMSDLCARLHGLLDAGAKAWWSTFDPGTNRVNWSLDYAQQHIPPLSGKAPAAITTSLNDALRRIEDLNRDAIGAFGRMPSGWRARAEEILALAQEGLTGLEDLLQQEVDLAVGEWVDLSRFGAGRIVQRDRERLVIDLGWRGVRVVSLFRTEFQRTAAPDEATPIPDTEPDWHHLRWLWFACQPWACHGLAPCPCCGLPGVRNGAAEACRLCGWVHDGQDFDPHRPSVVHPGLDLALARRRFAALGYAVGVADEPPGRQAAWLNPFVLARKRRLVAALDRLAAGNALDGEDGQRTIDLLWRQFERSLAEAGEGAL